MDQQETIRTMQINEDGEMIFMDKRISELDKSLMEEHEAIMARVLANRKKREGQTAE